MLTLGGMVEQKKPRRFIFKHLGCGEQVDLQRSKETVSYLLHFWMLKLLSLKFSSVKLGSNTYLGLFLCWIRDNVQDTW